MINNWLNPKNTLRSFSNNYLTINVNQVYKEAFSNNTYNNGKFYIEVKLDSGKPQNMFGICKDSYIPGSNTGWDSPDIISIYENNGNAYCNGNITAYFSKFYIGDLIGVQIDFDNKTIKFAKNNVWGNSITIPNTWNGYNFYFADASSTQGIDVRTTNFGATPFIYPPPAGFVSPDAYVEAPVLTPEEIAEKKSKKLKLLYSFLKELNFKI